MYWLTINNTSYEEGLGKEEESSVVGGRTGQYYQDQATGDYYFQPSNGALIGPLHDDGGHSLLPEDNENRSPNLNK